MAGATIAKLGELAEQHWGLFTTADAAAAGVARKTLSRLAGSEAIVRVAQGVYRVAGAPEAEHEPIYSAWLALGGADGVADGRSVPPVVAAGTTAAIVHSLGDFFPEGVEFIVPARRTTRLGGVRLRARPLDPQDVSWVDGLSALTVEATIADMAGQWVDPSLVVDAASQAYAEGRIVNPARLATLLAELDRVATEEILEVAGGAPSALTS